MHRLATSTVIPATATPWSLITGEAPFNLAVMWGSLYMQYSKRFPLTLLWGEWVSLNMYFNPILYCTILYTCTLYSNAWLSMTQRGVIHDKILPILISSHGFSFLRSFPPLKTLLIAVFSSAGKLFHFLPLGNCVYSKVFICKSTIQQN